MLEPPLSLWRYSVASLHFVVGRNNVPYLAGVLTGVVLTIFVVFLVDNLAVANAPSGTEPQKIVNWDVAAQDLHSSLTTLQRGVRELRENVHEATR
jgi:hypothetical protein